jgi:hypothetical protein
LKVNYAGCALCDSTWGDTWEEIDGERFFFCCPICAVQFRNVLDRVKQRTGWAHLDRLEIAGDRRGRVGTATRGDLEYRFEFAFNSEGALRRFEGRPS